MAGSNLPVIRIMPNTPVAVGKGVILYCCNDLVAPEVLDDVLRDLAGAGLLEPVAEENMDAACSVCGCGPAFAYLFLEAMAAGGVALGIAPEDALRYAAATISGAAEMAAATGEDPMALCRAVCSPGGSTIEGVKVLQERQLREIVTDCIAASYRRNRELGQ